MKPRSYMVLFELKIQEIHLTVVPRCQEVAARALDALSQCVQAARATSRKSSTCR